MAGPSVPYTFVNGTTASASEVNSNFQALINGLTDGTKDLAIAGLTCAGNLTVNGNATLGNASSDDLTVNASLASNIPIKANATYYLGSSTLGLAGVYLGTGSFTTKLAAQAGLAASYTFYFPNDAGTAGQLLVSDGTNAAWSSTVTAATTFTSGLSAGTGGSTLTFFKAGTWTPALTSLGGAFNSITYTTQEGYYYKIGTMVVIMCRIVWSAGVIGAASGQLVIGTLPYEPDTGNYNNTLTVLTSNLNWSAGSSPTAIPDITVANSLLLKIANDNSTYGTVDATDAVAAPFSKTIIVSGWYKATS